MIQRQMLVQMWLKLFNPKYFSFVLFFLLKLSTEHANGEFSVRRSSPNTLVVAQGQALQLNIILNGSDATMPMLVFLDWNFRAYRARFVKRLLSVTWDRGHVVSEEFYDERASILDSASLLLVDTTLKDAGSYWCNVFSLPSQHYPVLYFNVTVQGKPTAEIGCPDQVNVTQGKNFSCWCNTRSGKLTATTYWQMTGAPPFLDGRRRNASVELFLQNLNKRMAGTYVCRAQLYSMVDEKILTLTVLYAPTIHSFRGKILKDNSLKMTCVAKGLPQPTYVIKISNGLSFPAEIDGVVSIQNYKSVVNESYTCIAKNSVGRDQWHLNGMLTISKDETIINHNSSVQNHIWYIIIGSAVAGIFLGFLLLKAYQSLDCRKSERDDKNEQDLPVYVDPATLPMSQGRKSDPLNYIDVHVMPNIPQGGVNENMPVYVDPETVVSCRGRLREARGEQKQEVEDVQAGELPENDEAGELPENDDRVYQAPEESQADEGGESEDDRAEEEIQANPGSEETNRQNGPPITRPKPRANTEPMLGYQDLDSSDEIEENFYHSLRRASEGQPKTEYYVNEKAKVNE